MFNVLILLYLVFFIDIVIKNIVEMGFDDVVWIVNGK